MENEELLNKIKKEGGYQDVEINGKLIYSGWRSCAERWELIKPQIAPESVVMDIGSHYGYFAIKIAREIEKSVVWSIEGDKNRADIQNDILIKNNLKNIVLSQYQLGLIDFVKLSRVVEGIDIIMALSVFHYFKPDELIEIIGLCSRIAPKLIVEFPNQKEVNVASRDYVKEQPQFEETLKGFYGKIEKLGVAKAPVDKGIDRTIYLAENEYIEKVHLNSYLGYQTQRKYKIIYKNQKWQHFDKKKEWLPGLNVCNLKKFNLIYPDKETILNQAVEAYWKIIKTIGTITDLRYRNLLFTSSGLVPIDYKEKIGEEIYGKSWEEYKKEFEIITKTKEDLKKFLIDYGEL